MPNQRILLVLTACLWCIGAAAQPPMVTKHLFDFATPGGGGYPNDPINDHDAFMAAQAFFNDPSQLGHGTLILEDGEYIIGKQQLFTQGEALPPGPNWSSDRYPIPTATNPSHCLSMVAMQDGFTLINGSNFTIQGGANTSVRYRDCLYYGTFFRDELTYEITSAVGNPCLSCDNAAHPPAMLHAAVGVMFNFIHCDSIFVRDLELNGNIDAAIIGGRSRSDGIQTAYDGVDLYESSRCTVDNVRAHHFGRDGLHVWGNHTANMTPFMNMYPWLNVYLDPDDMAGTAPANRTVLFNNAVRNSSFNWNCRTGLAWAGCSGLTVTNCDMNYNAAGRFASDTKSGLDIEGVGGPMRVRHGVFTDCRILHNAVHGILADNGLCIGQQDFTFIDCVVKAGESGEAVWPNNKDMEFHDCRIYGRVVHPFEQAENQQPRDPDLDLLFHRTNFYEEDSLWSYLIADTTSWDSICGGGPLKVDLVAPYDQASSVTFDSCGFHTNCRGIVRLLGRGMNDLHFPYCSTGEGPYAGTPDPPLDARYVRATDCFFKNTGRLRCADTTLLLTVDYTTLVNFKMDVPNSVRGGGTNDIYSTTFGTLNWGLNCLDGSNFCSDVDTTFTPYGDEFPPCQPFFSLEALFDSTFVRWAFCNPNGNQLVQACASDANCYANITLPDSALATVAGTVFSGTVYIAGVFFVDDDVLFQNAQVFLAAGAEIVVQAGHTLDIENSSFTACNGIMWKGITATDGAVVRIRASFMDDAESLIEALDGSTIWVNDTQLHNNRVGISIPDSNLSYNNVACWVGNSTFYSSGPMPAPYPGQSTAVGAQGFAAVEVHRTALDFTGGGNIIHSMSNGIVAHKSHVVVHDCRFQSIHPDAAYDYVGNGAGIFARGGGFHSLKQTGYGMYGAPSFEDCRWGIYTEYMNVKSTENNMLGMGTAYRVDYSGFMSVDLLNNKVFTHRNGIDLRFNDGAQHVLVQGNDITFSAFDCSTNCPGYSAINVADGNYPAFSSRILDNTIHFVQGSPSRQGISLLAADGWVVANNALHMVDNIFNQNGILLDGCNSAEVSCNTITSELNTWINDRQAAIRNFMGSDPLISCNYMDRTTNGLLFNGVASGTNVRGNRIRRHKWGLHLGPTAIIEMQELKGNLWYDNPPSGGEGAWYQHLNNALANPFRYNPVIIDGGNTQPPSSTPEGWFVEWTFGPNYDCANDEGGDYCSQYRVRGAERLTDLDERVANDSLENDPYTEETKWMLKGELYKKLDDNPELQDSLQIMTEFYDELQGSTTAAFKAVDDGQQVLYHLDSSLVEQLQASSVQIDSLMTLVQDGLEEMGDSTLTSVQREAILNSISDYREDIRDLTTVSSEALQAAAEEKAIAAGNVQTMNDAVSASELIESNQKHVNDIYLATIGKDVDDFSATQAEALFEIAN